MLKDLTFLQIGLGSMGKRRINNLLSLGVSKRNISGFDVASSPRKEAERRFQIATFPSFNEAVNMVNPDVYIISTPPNLHSYYFIRAAKLQKHFFVEVSTTTLGYTKLLKLLDGSKFIAAPSCSFRFYYPIQKMRDIMVKNAIGKVLAFSYHMGQYLPDWHPWEDYRKVYFARNESSALMEMIPYEMGWLEWMFNSQVEKFKGIRTRVSNLDVSEDSAAAYLIMRNKLMGSILIEVLARYPIRNLRIIGSLGIIEWLWKNDILKIFETKKQRWRQVNLLKDGNDHKSNFEAMYSKELDAFLKAIEGKQSYPYTFAEDYTNLQLLKRFSVS